MNANAKRTESNFLIVLVWFPLLLRAALHYLLVSVILCNTRMRRVAKIAISPRLIAARVNETAKRLPDERNRHNLELLERCLCVVCIDDDVLPTTFNNPMKKEDRWIGDRDYANVLHHALHGGGSRHLGANRWFDKTFHAILGKVRFAFKSTVDPARSINVFVSFTA